MGMTEDEASAYGIEYLQELCDAHNAEVDREEGQLAA